MSTSTRPGKLAYSPREFAAAAGVPIRTVYDLIATGDLVAKVRKDGARPRYVIPAEAAHSWLDSLAAA